MFMTIAVRFARHLGVVFFGVTVAGGSALAQVTPILGSITGSEGTAREHIIDDILKDSIQNHIAGKDAAKPTGAFNTFALGRIRTTNHDGHEIAAKGAGADSVAAKSDEYSYFGAIGYRAAGWHPDSRVSVTGFVGETSLDTTLGAQKNSPFGPAFLGQTGTAKNDAVLGGLSANYSVGNFYFGGAFVYFDGETKADQSTGGLATIGTTFDTSGYMVSGAIGNSHEIGTYGGMRTFVMGEAGLRHVNMEGDRFFNRGRTTQFSTEYVTTTGSLTVGLFGVVPMGTMTLRPFTRLGVLADFQYDNDVLFFDPAGKFLEKGAYFRNGSMGQVEAGLGITSGNLNLSASAFTEWASDHETYGGKFAVRYDF
jgi:hypothetical protein